MAHGRRLAVLSSCLTMTMMCAPATPGEASSVNDSGVGDGGQTHGLPLDAGDSCLGVGPVSGLSQRCCPSLGVDACGPGLFCAAFDGRQYAACYADHARLDGQTCTDDRQCLSYACNPDKGVCRASPLQACSMSVGCGPGPSVGHWVCANGTCASTTGAVGAACGLGSECLSGYCVSAKCTEGTNGAKCATPSDCASRYCVSSSCTSGRDGAKCQTANDCQSNRCASGQCSDGAAGSECKNPSDCLSGFCVGGSCRTGAVGAACTSAVQCLGGAACVNACSPGFDCGKVCTDGSNGAPCDSNERCLNGLGCGKDGQDSWSCGGQCASNAQCKGGRLCSTTRSCIVAGATASGSRCTADSQCASALCAAHGDAGTTCSDVSGYWAPCLNANGSCAANFWCETSSSSPAQGRCVVGGGSACRRFHDRTEIWSSTCHSVANPCGARYLSAWCEGTTANCSADSDCGGGRCIVTWGCRN